MNYLMSLLLDLKNLWCSGFKEDEIHSNSDAVVFGDVVDFVIRDEHYNGREVVLFAYHIKHGCEFN